MRKALLALAAAGTFAATLVPAQALPTPRIATQDEASIVTQVRDGCGFRRHFDSRLRRCVWDHHHRRFF